MSGRHLRAADRDRPRAGGSNGATMREAAIDLENSPLAKRLFGVVVQNEVRERLASVMARQASK
jgi:hypothetical protein